MKKFCITFFALVIIIATVCFVAYPAATGADNDYLRIHVRANSNSAEDQQVKYEVKDEVVKFITPYVAQCVTKQKAIEVMNSLLPQIVDVCESALEERGYTYGARAEIREENFPTRVYDDVTLEEGVYDALIVELGSGTGDNWWCVIYPPLCFTAASADVTYRSYIFDIITEWINANRQ